MTDQHVTTAPPGDVYWRFTVPSSTGSKMLLLNLGGVAVIGNWQGALGEYFQAWCPLPKKARPQVHDVEAAVDAWMEMERKAAAWDEWRQMVGRYDKFVTWDGAPLPSVRVGRIYELQTLPN